MHESLARMQRIDPNVLMSYDYLLAGIDYTEFQYMMLDYKVSALPAIAYRVCVGCHVWGVRDSLIYLNTHPETTHFRDTSTYLYRALALLHSGFDFESICDGSLICEI